METKIKKVISFLESRSELLKNEFNENSEISGLTKEQSRDVKICKIGESRGIDLCVLTLKRIILKEQL